MTGHLLSVEDLSVLIRRPGRDVAALSGVSLHVDAGEVVGLVGESGGGKSMVARAIVALLPGGSQTSGAVRFEGADVLAMDEAALADHRGHGAALCFQNPRGALSPTRTVGRQLTDRLTTHQKLDKEAARETARQLFEAVGIRNPARRLEAYPHELSGGMAQRVMISLATGCAPGLLIADEPTTGLDVTLTREILRQFRHAADTDGRGVLLISHDLASIAPICDRVVVLYAGTVVESGPAAKVLREPVHPYTRALLASVPDVSGRPARAIGGAMPLLSAPPEACPFAPRCAHATDRCTAERPALTGDGWRYACFHPQSGAVTGAPTAARTPKRDAGHVVMEIDDAHVVYGSRFGSGGHHALRGVSLRVRAGETVGVVGESGCGKSTLARLMLGLTAPTSGTVRLTGTDLHALRGKKLRRLRTKARLVFQDPVGSLSPRRTVADAIGEPLRALGVPAAEREQRVAEVLARMNLDAAMLRRRPHELSGGQAQRVGIARALVGNPDLIVFDEPTSALDVTVQAQILDVIAELAGDASRGSVFISHDLATVRGFCDRVVVLYLGRIVEQGPVEEVFGNPRHPYTRALLSSAPSLDGGFTGSQGWLDSEPGAERAARIEPAAGGPQRAERARLAEPRVELAKDLDEADAATGCPLAARCPFATDECRAEPQQLIAYGASEAACWRVPQIPGLLRERTHTSA